MVITHKEKYTKEFLSKYFHLPITEVSKSLGICTTMLKKICRKNGISRWPYRKIRSIDKILDGLEILLRSNPPDADEISREIAFYRFKRQNIISHPEILTSSKKRGVKNQSDDSDDAGDSDVIPNYTQTDPGFPSSPPSQNNKKIMVGVAEPHNGLFAEKIEESPVAPILHKGNFITPNFSLNFTPQVSSPPAEAAAANTLLSMFTSSASGWNGIGNFKTEIEIEKGAKDERKEKGDALMLPPLLHCEETPENVEEMDVMETSKLRHNKPYITIDSLLNPLDD